MNVKNTINKILTASCVLLVSFTANAQKSTSKSTQKSTPTSDAKVKHLPSIMLGVGAQKFFGYIGSHTSVNPLLDARMCYFLAIEQRFGKILGAELSGVYGKLAGTDNQTTVSNGVTTMYHGNFQSQNIQANLMLTLHFDKVMKGDPTVSPFFKVGVGYMMYNTYSDLKDKNGNPYQYQTDGSIMASQTISVGGISTQTLIPTKRDYTYETQLGSGGCLVIPAMLGLDFNFGKHMSSMIGVGYNFCLSNQIDHSGQGMEFFINAHAGIRYTFGKTEKDKSDAMYKDVDFASIDKLDADKDGVTDDKDMCHGTPAGVKVDAKGCPLDADGDGVPDYLDKEPNTAKGNKVDGYGVTIDEAAMAQRQKDWENQAPARSKEFNVMPSKEYLKKVEEQSRKTLKNSGGTTTAGNSKIPTELRSADINNDGFISADEITKTIDAFFEGDNSDFTVEKINKLIDYFFEQ